MDLAKQPLKQVQLNQPATHHKEIVANEKIDIFFLTETDTKLINCETDYKIQGFQTIFHERNNPNDVQRVICNIKIKTHLLTTEWGNVFSHTLNQTYGNPREGRWV